MAADAPNSESTDPQPRVPQRGSGRTRFSGRILGIIPNSRRNRVFFAWAVINVVLTFLPVWDVAFNSEQMVGGVLPLTILWSYLVFTSNMALGIALYFIWARGWAIEADTNQRFAAAGESTPVRPEAEGR